MFLSGVEYRLGWELTVSQRVFRVSKGPAFLQRGSRSKQTLKIENFGALKSSVDFIFSLQLLLRQ